MAESVSRTPGVTPFVLGGIDVATRVDLPNTARRIRVIFTTNDGKVAFTGTDAAAISANYWKVPADTEVSFFVDQDAVPGGRGPVSVYLASAIATTTVSILAEAG